MKIFSFDTRNCILWSSVKDYFNLDDKSCYEIINTEFENTKSLLKENKINYYDLRHILTPSNDRQEVCFVFDSMKTKNESCYGIEILSYICPEILKLEKVAVFYGDIIYKTPSEDQSKIKPLLQKYFPNKDFSKFVIANQYFVVYVNNLTPEMILNINKSQKTNPSYIGFIDMTYSSFLKNILSSCIRQQFIKIKNKICVPVPEDNNNPDGYVLFDFSNHGFKLIGITDYLYSSFLSYKIQRSYFDFDNKDQKFSLNAVLESPEIISNYDIKIDDDKFNKYLHGGEKLGTLQITGLDTLSKENFIKYIRFQINSNYIFNIEINFYDEKPCIKFATILESFYKSKRKRYILVFEMLKDTKELRLITMY